MIIKSTSIPNVLIIQPKIHKDNRGYFFESYKKTNFSKNGLPTEFVQDNQSQSSKGVLRGLHYQLKHAQGKLVSVIMGKVLDVAVDIRKGSPTFGQYVTCMLDNRTHTQFYLPPGFAHAFYVLSDKAIFQYKCTDFYHPEDEYGINWNDPDIGIEWGDGDKFVSEKDKQLPNLSELDKALLPTYNSNQ